MSELIQIKVIFKGKVQGVFFRHHIKNVAEKYKIFGYVKNNLDGSVEMVAISTKDILNKFLEEIKKNSGFGSIESIDKSYSKKIDKFSDFKIIH